MGRDNRDSRNGIRVVAAVAVAVGVDEAVAAVEVAERVVRDWTLNFLPSHRTTPNAIGASTC